METLRDSSIEGFTPLSAYRVRGIGYVGLQGPEGVALDVSEQGLTALDRSAELAGLLERMGGFIAEHNGYKEPGSVMLAEPVDVLTLSHPSATGGNMVISEYERNDPIAIERYQSAHIISIYRPRLQPDVIIKAYDDEVRLAPVQFYAGNWLHKRFEQADGDLRFPRQLAMFTAPSKHRTVVMDFVPGETLKSICDDLKNKRDYPKDSVDKFASTVRFRIRKMTQDHLGERGFFIVNDLKALENIILDTTEPIDPQRPLDRPIGLIDQPAMALPSAVILHALQKKLTSRRWQEAQRAAPLAHPSNSTA